MAKTKPIGVRFDLELLETFKTMGLDTPQKVLSFLEADYKAREGKRIEVGKALVDMAKGRLTKVQITNFNTEPPKTDYEINTLKARLEVVTKEYMNPPPHPLIGMKKYLAVREMEIQEINQKLNSHE